MTCTEEEICWEKCLGELRASRISEVSEFSCVCECSDNDLAKVLLFARVWFLADVKSEHSSDQGLCASDFRLRIIPQIISFIFVYQQIISDLIISLKQTV